MIKKASLKVDLLEKHTSCHYDIMHNTEITQVPGLLMLHVIDFEKAFDTVSWNFIQDALHFFKILATQLKAGFTPFIMI